MTLDDEMCAVEALMLEMFRVEPFHNLRLRFGLIPTRPGHGGTCSDKALSFYREVKQMGFNATLHAASIGGLEIHRMVKVAIQGLEFLADVGNGWPSTKLFPLHRDAEFQTYGISFRSAVKGDRLVIANVRRGVERRQMEVPLESKAEPLILSDIDNRFARDLVYPFSEGLRFSQIVGDSFRFLRDETLEIYEASGDYREVIGLNPERYSETIAEFFDFDLDDLVRTGGTEGSLKDAWERP